MTTEGVFHGGALSVVPVGAVEVLMFVQKTILPRTRDFKRGTTLFYTKMRGRACHFTSGSSSQRVVQHGVRSSRRIAQGFFSPSAK